MKVVQINAVYEYSSTGKIVKELHMELKQRGYESYVFCSNYEDASEGIYCMGTNLSRKIHGLLSRISGMQGYFSIKATKKMLKQFDVIKPDVVHLGNLHGNYIHVNMLLDYLIKHQISTVITLHDCWLFTGHCCHYLEDNCDRWQYGCGKCPAKHKWNKSWFFDMSAKVYADRKSRFERIKNLTVVGVSDWVTNECRKSFMKGNAHFLRIYNWIDLEQFKPVLRNSNSRPIVLSVSQSWSDIKGLSDIINIARTRPEYDFIMIGEMPKSIELPENIKAKGVINDVDKLVEQYQSADVFLHLSYQETFGKVIAEALACGTPAIVYNVTAMPELIGEGCGAVVEKGDWRKASKEISNVLQCNREVCQRFAASCFEKRYLLDEWIRLYQCCSDQEI